MALPQLDPVAAAERRRDRGGGGERVPGGRGGGKVLEDLNAGDLDAGAAGNPRGRAFHRRRTQRYIDRRHVVTKTLTRHTPRVANKNQQMVGYKGAQGFGPSEG
jgi:hypothetical protein